MKRTKSKRISHHTRTQTRIVVAIVFVVVAAVFFNAYRTHAKSQEYAAQEAELDLQIAAAEAEKAELEEWEEYMKTDAYKEQVAREEFGMVKKGEYILKDSSASN